MKINIELNTKDIANAKQESISMITTALQAIAQADEATPMDTEPAPIVMETTEKEQPTFEPEKEQPAFEPESKVKAVKKVAKPKKEQKERDKDIELEPPVVQAAQEKADTQEEPVTQKKEDTQEESQDAGVDRQTVQNRLKEIAKAGKAKGIKEILTKRGVRKFSELPDDELADVLKEAEAL